MRKFLNTLYVTQDTAYLALDGENLVVLKDGKEIYRTPFCNIEGIVCFSYPGCSPALMAKCAEESISLNFVSPYGKFLARVTGKIRGNIVLRHTQLKKFDDADFCLDLAKIVITKLFNCKSLLYRHARDYNNTDLAAAVETMQANIESINGVADIDSLRGIEGESARIYFLVFDKMILNRDFSFNGRTKRPPLDEVNCLLSFVYTLLNLDVVSALETVGLDPYAGFMHAERSGRASLASDMIEELRVLADKFVLNLVNLKIMTKQDFFIKEDGSVLMTDESRRKLLKHWQEKKKEEFYHDVIGEKIEYGLLPYVQAQILARFLRGDIKNYMPYLNE